MGVWQVVRRQIIMAESDDWLTFLDEYIDEDDESGMESDVPVRVVRNGKKGGR